MSLRVIDVSEHQGVIDWNVAKGHIDEAILRCGFGDDSTSQDDKQWKRNADECTRLGIPFGVYIYSYATSMAQAESEAQHALRCVKGYKLSYPIYLDLEEPGTQSGAVERAKRFGAIIESAGYWCGIYANLSWWNNYLVGLDQFTKWVAQYNSKCDYTGSNKDIWQYSSSGSVPGIGGNVDMNECYRDFPAEISGKVAPAKQKPTQRAGNPYNDFGVWYRAYCETVGLLPAVRDGQVAGLTGYSKRLEGLMIDIDKIRERFGEQIKINVRLHLQGKGNVLYEDISRDTYMGTKEEKRRVEMLEIEIIGLPEEYVLEYDVHVKGEGWLGYALSGFGNGSAGMAIRIEAFRLRIRKIK